MKFIFLTSLFIVFLEYIKPDVIHIMIDGKIVKSGDMTLVHEVEKNGYSWLVK